MRREYLPSRVRDLLFECSCQCISYSVVLIEEQVLDGGQRCLGLCSAISSHKVSGLVTVSLLHVQIKLTGKEMRKMSVAQEFTTLSFAASSQP